MRLHILGFLYDLRHAYQGSRDIKAVDNGLSDEQKEYYGINKSIKKDILYDFDYVVPELLTDILLFKHFVKSKNKKISEYDTNYNSVMAFYSKVIDALQEILTENQVKRVRKRLSYLYDEYHEIKNEVEQYAKENNINETEIEYGDYPKEIEW